MNKNRGGSGHLPRSNESRSIVNREVISEPGSAIQYTRLTLSEAVQDALTTGVPSLAPSSDNDK